MFSLPCSSSQNLRQNVSKYPHNHVLYYGDLFSQEQINHKQR